MSGLSPLVATFELRYVEAWRLWYDGENDAAEAKAAELLLEPRLGRFHQAGMHMLLSTASHYYLEHALEAVRLYTEVSEGQNLTDTEREDIAGFLADANKLLDRARQDKTRIDREIQVKDVTNSQDKPGKAKESQHTESKLTTSQDAQSQGNVPNDDWDMWNDPLPDIVRYNRGSDN